MTSSPYSFLLVGGLILSFIFWRRMARRDPRLLAIYLSAVGGAFFGAKVVYLAAEGWMFWKHPDRWLIWATGKTILGALLGGYAGVELAKKVIGYTAPTGDWFALIAPGGIAMGRVGCLLHGCCPGQECPPAWWTIRDAKGITRWPAVPLELGFNLTAVAVFLVLQRCKRLPGQHFHLYLMGYGCFRFAHEWMRDTPRLAGEFSGYHLAALAVAGLGLVGFLQRQRTQRHIRTSFA
jgi:phosphatidylglycerol---prolipoprotein diacylglyceryl transferase